MTDKPRFSLTLNDDTFSRLEAYQAYHGFATRSRAAQTLIENALDRFDNENPANWGKKKSRFGCSEAALRLAKLYDLLDAYGKDAVRELARMEHERCEDEERLLRESGPSFAYEPRIIPDYTFGSAAGPLQGITGQESVPYELRTTDPQSAVYTTTVRGNSMAPHFPDGSRIFVNNDPLRDGDIGIFCVDGANVMKQWHYDAAMGVTYLFSLNRRRADADLVIPDSDNRAIVAQGRVITSHRYPLPEERGR